MTPEQENLHAAMIRAATWHLMGRPPDDSVAGSWAALRDASLGDMVEAARLVREAPSVERVDEDGRTVRTVQMSLDDRLVAALYVAAHYDVDEEPIVARPEGRNAAVAIMAARARLRGRRR